MRCGHCPLNGGEGLVIFKLAVVLGGRYQLLRCIFLWVNMTTRLFFLGLKCWRSSQKKADIMQRPPNEPNAPYLRFSPVVA